MKPESTTKTIEGKCKFCETGFKSGEVKCSSCGAVLSILKKPVKKRFKGITKRMLLIWSVCFVTFVAITFGSISLGLSLNRVAYGASINFDQVQSIKYMNTTHQKQLFDKKDPLHSETMKKILNLLSQSGKTNKLENLFRPEQTEQVTINTTNYSYDSTFINKYSKNALIIKFNAPQFSTVDTSSRTKYILADASANKNRQVYEILIPLDKIGNKFQEQTWFLLTSNPNSYPSGQSLSLLQTFNTYGNYYKLGNYVNDLHILL